MSINYTTFFTSQADGATGILTWRSIIVKLLHSPERKYHRFFYPTLRKAGLGISRCPLKVWAS